MCKTKKTGTSAINLKKAARRLGFKIKGVDQRRGNGVHIVLYASSETTYHFVTSVNGKVYNYFNNKYIRITKRHLIFSNSYIFKIY